MPKAQLFLTCLDDQFYTSALQNMTLLLERLGVKLVFPPKQTCCGQWLFNNGFESTFPSAFDSIFLDSTLPTAYARASARASSLRLG